MTVSPFETHLDKTAANHVPLSPLGFLARTAAIFPNRTAVVYGSERYSWADAYQRCRQLASALRKRGIGKNDVVAVMLPNIPPAWEAHHFVPMAGGVLNALNTRLDADTIAYILAHGGAKILIADTEFHPVVEKALTMLRPEERPLVVDFDDPQSLGDRRRLGDLTYDALLAEGDPDDPWDLPADEWDAISLNYTSGTTGDPKGVVYHHRGAYLNAVGNQLVWFMPRHPVYLWTLPMFHCNGWCFPWTITALAGTHVCLRKVDGRAIWEAIGREGVTHLCGAPIVMQMLLGIDADKRASVDHMVQFMTAASAPPAAVLERMAQAGVEVTHVYGLTEVYGPAVVCEWHESWSSLPIEEQAAIKARQGVNYPVLEPVMVADPETMDPVPADGETIGEVMMRGHIVMKGYLKNKEATDKAFAGGWFHTGDLGVMHPDGYIELKDRSKDIIISGGENISTIEIEGVLYRHPDVADAAVVARPDEKWGETPCAFVTLKPGASTTQADIIAFCRDRMAHFKAPKTVIFCELPKTSTGKIQKFVLREQARAL